MGIVFCHDCNQWKKERDCIYDSEEGYICSECLEKQNKYIKNKKNPSLEKWL